MDGWRGEERSSVSARMRLESQEQQQRRRRRFDWIVLYKSVLYSMYIWIVFVC
jgi:hypothetical protein